MDDLDRLIEDAEKHTNPLRRVTTRLTEESIRELLRKMREDAKNRFPQHLCTTPYDPTWGGVYS